MPAYLGLFIDSLAVLVDELTLFMHVGTDLNTAEYVIKSSNVTLISLGSAGPAYKRFYLPHLYFDSGDVKSKLRKCDYILVRSPSPLAPAFTKYIDKRRIVYFIVGSYKEGLKFLDLPWYKLWAVKLLNHHMHAALGTVVKGQRTLVNSESLFQEYRSVANSIMLVNTTTLSESDFFRRVDTCVSSEIKLLFVGRIDLSKGVGECIEVCGRLRKQNINATLSIVGWEGGGTRATTNLNRLVGELRLGRFVRFEGRKRSGIELLTYYRTHDIYLLPSYHEGFPRTIWEAFANSIPVISTKVGSIPAFVRHGHEALLVAPRNVNELHKAIESIIEDGPLRRRLIQNGYERVKDVRLDIQSKRIVEFIKK